MIGAIAGDIIGSVYEFGRTKSKEFPLFVPDSIFTDDTVMTVAIAQATALSVFLARTVRDKDLIRTEITARFGYDLARTVDDIRPSYSFDESCQRTVPEAIVAFLESTSYEDAVRNAVSLGGDSDTLACITGGIAEAFYGPVSQSIRQKVQKILTSELWKITEAFCAKYSGMGIVFPN